MSIAEKLLRLLLASLCTYLHVPASMPLAALMIYTSAALAAEVALNHSADG
jgi:hypothetical protein